MRILNALVSGTVDVLLYPFRDLPPLVGLTVLSVITAVAVLLIFKATSDQEALAAVKRQMHAGIFEIRLFSDDPRAILSAQGDIVRYSLNYMRLTLVPLLWLSIPLSLLIVQLQYRYGYYGLEVGSEAIVKVKLNADWTADEPPLLELNAPSGVTVETPLLWIPSLNQADWRIRAQRPGIYRLRIRLGEAEMDKSVLVSNSVVRRRSVVRPSGRLLSQVLYPVEPPLPAGPIESIAVDYPEAEVSLLGWETHWLVVFFILTTIGAFALHGLFRVAI